jgi:hypothetical protein
MSRAMLFMIMVHMWVWGDTADRDPKKALIVRTRINWYMATVQAQLVYYTSDEGLADKLTNGTLNPSPYRFVLVKRSFFHSLLMPAFIFLLPVGGIVSKQSPAH